MLQLSVIYMLHVIYILFVISSIIVVWHYSALLLAQFFCIILWVSYHCLFVCFVLWLFVCLFLFLFFSVLVLLINLFWFLTIIFIIIIFLFLCLFLFLPDVKPVLYDDWLRIDCEEKRRGEEVGKPREKMTSIEEMMHYAFKK